MTIQMEQNHSQAISLLLNGFNNVFKGKPDFVEKVLAAWLSGGHVLLEDLPGTGKTVVGKTLSRLVDGAIFKRIQFTPDLLPYDITGMDTWDEHSREFVFRPGPVFANVVLADEINRTTPKVQSALLEAMAECQVTVGNKTRPLREPFLVLATQNPVETEGTYPLPEAQKDRFMLRLHPGYPDKEVEYAIVKENPSENVLPKLASVVSMEDLLTLKRSAQNVHVDERLAHCAVDTAAVIRNHPDVRLGVSTRGVLMLISAMKGLAFIKGRGYATDQDLADLAVDVYAHRITMRNGSDAEELVRNLAQQELRRLPRG